MHTGCGACNPAEAATKADSLDIAKLVREASLHDSAGLGAKSGGAALQQLRAELAEQRELIGALAAQLAQQKPGSQPPDSSVSRRDTEPMVQACFV